MNISDAFVREIARCEREIAEMLHQEPVQPAYLTTLGIEDWEGEKRILQRMAAQVRQSVGSEEVFHGRLSARVDLLQPSKVPER